MADAGLESAAPEAEAQAMVQPLITKKDAPPIAACMEEADVEVAQTVVHPPTETILQVACHEDLADDSNDDDDGSFVSAEEVLEEEEEEVGPVDDMESSLNVSTTHTDPLHIDIHLAEACAEAHRIVHIAMDAAISLAVSDEAHKKAREMNESLLKTHTRRQQLHRELSAAVRHRKSRLGSHAEVSPMVSRSGSSAASAAASSRFPSPQLARASPHAHGEQRPLYLPTNLRTYHQLTND